MRKEEKQDYWSECGQIFFHCGKGYGVTSKLTDIYLGTEEEIKQYFETDKHDFNPDQLEVLKQILIYRKEEGIGTEDIRAASVERTGDIGPSGDKTRATRPPTSRKRIPLRTPRKKSACVSGR